MSLIKVIEITQNCAKTPNSSQPLSRTRRRIQSEWQT